MNKHDTFTTDWAGEEGGETDNAKREDTKMTSKLKALVRPFNKKRRRKKQEEKKV